MTVALAMLHFPAHVTAPRGVSRQSVGSCSHVRSDLPARRGTSRGERKETRSSARPLPTDPLRAWKPTPAPESPRMARARDDRLGWFRVDVDLTRHPKVHALAKANGWTPRHAVGELIAFWSWVAEFRIEGILSEADLDLMRSCGVAIDALTAGSFVERVNPKTWRARNWMDYNGYAVREAIRKRAIPARAPRAESAPTGRDVDSSSLTQNLTGRDVEPKSDSESPPAPAAPAPKGASAKFVRPTIQEVATYCDERAAMGKPRVDPEAWYGHYEACGWRVGRNPMRNWKATFASTWERQRFGARAGPANGKLSPGQLAEFARQQKARQEELA